MRFEPNAGQSPDHVKFVARGLGYGVFITPTETTFRFGSATLRMTLAGANRSAEATGVERMAARANYFVGSDPRTWRTDVPEYGRVQIHGVYPGIDLTYYGTQDRLEYDFIAAPGADPAAIALGFDGARSIGVDRRGDLLLDTPAGLLRQQKPYAYQVVNGANHAVDCRYAVERGTVRFRVGAHDARLPLVIDPVIAYSSLLGGTGDDQAFAIAIGANGNIFVVGFTESANFPVANAYSATSPGNLDGFIVQLNASGSALVYATYLGGTLFDSLYGVAVDAQGNAYVTGQTQSFDFPITANALQQSHSSSTAVVAMLNPAGQLAYSSYLGSQSAGEQIAVDAAGNVYAAGSTSAPDFPTTPTALQPQNGEGSCTSLATGGCEDGFVAKFVPGANGAWSVGYSTYVGGRGHDSIYGLAVDATGNMYVAGQTTSDDFPTTVGATQPANAGGRDGFVMRLDANGTLQFSTYFGGSLDDRARAVAVDSSGGVYIAGFTASSDLALTSALQPVSRGGGDAFVAKWTSTGALAYATYLGGSGQDHAYALAVDANRQAYVAGSTSSADFPVEDAFQMVNKSQSGNGFISKLNASGTSLVYSSYFGGGGYAAIVGMALDADCSAVVTGVTIPNSAINVFPVVDAFQAAPGGGSDAFVARITPYDESGEEHVPSMEPLPVAASDIIRSVIETIRDLIPRVTDGRDKRSLQIAIDDLTAALDPALWRDANHPRREGGFRVFVHDNMGARELDDLTRRGHGSVPAVAVHNWIAVLVSAARAAALSAIDDPYATLPNRSLDKLLRDLTHGDALAAAGKASDAILEYGRVWMDTRRVLR